MPSVADGWCKCTFIWTQLKRKAKTSTIGVMFAIVMPLLMEIQSYQHCRQIIMSNIRDRPKKQKQKPSSKEAWKPDCLLMIYKQFVLWPFVTPLENSV